jgi:hypothetical protein
LTGVSSGLRLLVIIGCAAFGFDVLGPVRGAAAGCA